MSQPYEPIIRHEVGPDGLVRCPGCRSGMLNRPCGDPECTCTCNQPPIIQFPQSEPVANTGPEWDQIFVTSNDYGYDAKAEPADTSFITGLPIGDAEIFGTEPVTAELVSDPHREGGAFLLGILMGLPMGIVGMADSINPWVRGILIGLSVLTALFVIGRMSREDR